MRGMVIGTGLVLALLAGGWLGAETLASNRVAALIAQDPALQAASVSPLRDPRQSLVKYAADVNRRRLFYVRLGDVG